MEAQWAIGTVGSSIRWEGVSANPELLSPIDLGQPLQWTPGSVSLSALCASQESGDHYPDWQILCDTGKLVQVP